MSDAPTRNARIKSDLGNEAEAKRLCQTVARYLPGNYSCHTEFWMQWEVIITGQDYCGWTMDDYVIPRLASGLIWAEEIELPE